MSLGERIKEARDKNGYKQSELAELIDVKSAGVISNWEKDINKPDADKIIKLCEVLHISASYLLDYYDNTVHLSFEEQEHIKKYRALDEHGSKIVNLILNEEFARCTAEAEEPDIEFIYMDFVNAPVSAGLGDMLDDGENIEKVKVPLTRESRKANFVLRVHGQSMEPLYFDGDYVLVRQQPAVNIGQVGIFAVDGDGYIKKMGENMLISLNPDYQNVELNEYTEFKCFGLVLGTTEIIDE